MKQEMALDNVKENVGKNKIPFTSYDVGWVIMCIGMAIGSGIVFMPLQMSVKGFWATAIALLITYPIVYLLTKLYITSLSETQQTDYAGTITQYLGRNWGAFLSFLYFFTILKGMLGYAATITNDTSSYLQRFGVTQHSLSDTLWFPLVLLVAMVLVASRGERLLFKISGPFIVFKLMVIIVLGALMVPYWNINNVSMTSPDSLIDLMRDVLVSLPFALFSIVFIQVLNPMNIAFRKIESDPKIATFRALRASRIAYIILVVSVLFFAFSFMFSTTPEQAEMGISQNTSALALMAKIIPENTGGFIPVLSVLLSISAILTSFFGIYLGFYDALSGIIINIADRFIVRGKKFNNFLPYLVTLTAIILLWGWVVADVSTMALLQWTVGTFGLVSCLIPCYLIWRVPSLQKYKSPAVIFVSLMGFMLVVSPLFKLLEK
ncbi:amino acid permease [Citrobacter freundii]|uniref:aromatic amino acid transport family protein n=1 Tax=Citrobacter TaxID=544 RepID=UPI0022EB21DE|nr:MULTISPECIES: aromatic amino acid transport family protein [Citrobacter]MDE9654842.1 amino acid permease [Citrobacter freundii]MDM3252953.1 amino acid permease [Citrobacter sp. Cf072]MDQ9165252.1 aromatic amino acid transport family protein [Citrobacter freundii]HDS4602849.1 transporter [Citrobacter freundii]